MGWWGHENPHGLRYELEDMQLVGDPQFVIGFPKSHDIEFKKSVFAAAKAYFAGYSSIDYTLKKYGHYWNFENEDEDERIISSGTREVKRIVITHLNYLMEIKNKPDRPSLYACSAAFIRLQSTFKACILTIKSGLHFETIALERVILEQLAWIYTIHDKPGMSHFDILPNECITNLKKFISFAGKLYGIFCEYTHISPTTTHEYIKPSEDGGLKIVLTNLELIKQDLVYLLVLGDMLGIIGEYVYSSLIEEHKFIRYDSNKADFVLNEERETLKIIREYQSHLERFK